MSNHNFPIERMRYTKTKQEERICTICNLNQVRDEMHYLLYCTNTKIENQRGEFINDKEAYKHNLDILNMIIS